jgi:hypothetical protein
MPAVFWERGFKFHFYSSEGEPLEPIHVTLLSAAQAMPSSGCTLRSPLRIIVASMPGHRAGSFVSLRTVG